MVPLAAGIPNPLPFKAIVSRSGPPLRDGPDPASWTLRLPSPGLFPGCPKGGPGDPSRRDPRPPPAMAAGAGARLRGRRGVDFGALESVLPGRLSYDMEEPAGARSPAQLAVLCTPLLAQAVHPRSLPAPRADLLFSGVDAGSRRADAVPGGWLRPLRDRLGGGVPGRAARAPVRARSRGRRALRRPPRPRRIGGDRGGTGRALGGGGLLRPAVLHYVRVRRAGGPIPRKTELYLAGIYLLGCLFKENALMLPGFLVLAEALLVPGGEPLGARIARGRRLLLVLMLVGVGFYGIRTLVLGGDLLGTFVAEGLARLTVAQRGLTMLAVVPQWFRLLLWPAHLQSDYSPAEIVAQTAWGVEQTVGALLAAGTALAIVMAWRKAPAISCGLLWAAVAIFPVHNVLVPTGIVLAERTLFLPSIGAMIALGGLGALLLERADDPGRLAPLLAGLAGALVILGVLRSTTRHPVWSDQFGLWYETGNHDAPRSYRAHAALAEMYFLTGLEGRAEQEYRLAIEYAPPKVAQVMLDYANKLRLRGHCYPAVDLYCRALEIHPNDIASRASQIACLLQIGGYKEAMLNARLGISFDYQRPTFQRALRTADSALKAGAPPGTVKLIVAPGDSSAGYLHIGTAP